MAVDTAAKQSSLIGFGFVTLGPLPQPDGGIDEANQNDLVGLYAGITLADPPVIVIPAAPVNLRPEVSISIFPPLNSGNDEQLNVGLEDRIVAGRVTTTYPGGYGVAEVQLRLDPLHTTADWTLPGEAFPAWSQPFNHVELWAGGFVLFEGRIMARTVLGHRLAIDGYWTALEDDIYETAGTASTTSGEILQDVLTNAAPLIHPAAGDGWVDPQVEHAPVDFDFVQPRSVADATMTEGDSQGRPMAWAIWEQRRMELRRFVAPSEPDYLIPFDRQIAESWVEDPRQLAGAIIVEYNASDSGTATVTDTNTSVTVGHSLGFAPDAESFRLNLTNTPTNSPGTPSVQNITSSQFDIVIENDPGASGATFAWIIEAPGARTGEASDDTFVDRWGLQRRRPVRAGAITTTAAEQVRDTELEESQEPVPSVQIQREWDDPLTNIYGVPVPNYAVRAGQWVQVGGMRPLAIIGTDYDILTGALTITLNRQPPTRETLLAEMERREQRRRQGLDALIGRVA